MEKRPRRFYPLSSNPKRYDIAAIATFGHGANGGHVYTACISELETVVFADNKDALEYLLSPPLRGAIVYAHDLEQTVSVITQGDFTRLECTFSSGGLLWIEQADKHNHKWRMWDVGNLLPGVGIEQLGLMVNMARLPVPPHLERWLKNNHPASELGEDETREVRRIVVRDAQILHEALSQLQDELHSIGTQLRATVSGVSMDLFRRRFMTDSWPVLDQNINTLARVAYYGARTEPYRLGRVNHLNGYDITSLYPSVMSTGDYPYPNTLSYEEHVPNFAHLLEREGIAKVKVKVKECDVPVLPSRMNNQLFFPTGEFEGVWTNRELRYAASHGVEILSCDFVLWSGVTFSPFEDFINTLYNLRVLSASDSPIREQMYKLLMNSAYGRYGLNPDNELYTLKGLPDNPDWESLRGAYLYEIGQWIFALVPRTDFGVPAYANALIAAHITTDARLVMHEQISQNSSKLAYTDTDSLWTTGKVLTGEGLGEIRQTHSGVDMWIVAPKEYAIFHNEALIEAHAKGIPEQHREMYLRLGSVLLRQPTRMKDALKRSKEFGAYQTIRKERQENLPKRAPLGLRSSGAESYQTRPWDYLELVSLLG